MFRDYFALVSESYKSKRLANALSPMLTLPTSAKVKKESINVCLERFKEKDKAMLRSFFGPAADQESFVRVIRRSDPNKFKPIVNFLKGRTNTTDEKNIELLAWLIDFEPRPFELGRRYDAIASNSTDNSLPQNRVVTDDKDISNQNDTPNKQIREKKWPVHYPYSKLAFRGIIALACVLGLVGYFASYKKGIIDNAQQFCMYWNGDHYEPISCRTKMHDTIVVALDSARLLRFKKVMRPDTITMNSLGKLWYFKKEGKLEFYTSSGQHPVFVNATLKPVTAYIINKYILEK